MVAALEQDCLTIFNELDRAWQWDDRLETVLTTYSRDENERIRSLLSDRAGFIADIERLRAERVYNLGASGRAGAEHIARIADSLAERGDVAGGEAA